MEVYAASISNISVDPQETRDKNPQPSYIFNERPTGYRVQAVILDRRSEKWACARENWSPNWRKTQIKWMASWRCVVKKRREVNSGLMRQLIASQFNGGTTADVNFSLAVSYWLVAMVTCRATFIWSAGEPTSRETVQTGFSLCFRNPIMWAPLYLFSTLNEI